MRIYRVAYYAEHGSSCGFEWFSNLKRANKAAREWREVHKDVDDSVEAKISRYDFTRTTESVLTLLNKVADHADNG